MTDRKTDPKSDPKLDPKTTPKTGPKTAPRTDPKDPQFEALLDYLRRTNESRYKELIERLGIRR